MDEAVDVHFLYEGTLARLTHNRTASRSPTVCNAQTVGRYAVPICFRRNMVPREGSEHPLLLVPATMNHLTSKDSRAGANNDRGLQGGLTEPYHDT